MNNSSQMSHGKGCKEKKKLLCITFHPEKTWKMPKMPTAGKLKKP